jgi:hypothetical protein
MLEWMNNFSTTTWITLFFGFLIGVLFSVLYYRKIRYVFNSNHDLCPDCTLNSEREEIKRKYMEEFGDENIEKIEDYDDVKKSKHEIDDDVFES